MSWEVLKKSVTRRLEKVLASMQLELSVRHAPRATRHAACAPSERYRKRIERVQLDQAHGRPGEGEISWALARAVRLQRNRPANVLRTVGMFQGKIGEPQKWRNRVRSIYFEA